MSIQPFQRFTPDSPVAPLPDALLLLGPAGQSSATEAAYRALLPALCERLRLPATACLLEFREQPLLGAFQQLIDAGCRRLVVVPLALEYDDHQHTAIFGALDWERARNPGLDMRYASVLGGQPSLITALAARAAEALAADDRGIAAAETALLVVGRGGNDPENNAALAKVARLLWEGRPYGWVETGYYCQTQPDIATALARCICLGARQIVVVPYWLHTGRSGPHILAQTMAVQAHHPHVPIHVAASLGDHAGVIDALVQQVGAALAGNQPQRVDHQHGAGGSHRHSRPLVDSLLPPRYRGGQPVSAAPMSAAPLVYDEEGRVAWDRMWGRDDPDSPFCELALAGGPPHRDVLLEPVTPAAVQADWVGYSRVLAELTRGISLTTGLRTQLSSALGWIGVQCHSEAMALWLLRAIVVENISVRREGSVLYLPAGPAFRLEHEIKNVITALAKTCHYWQEHR